MERGASGRKVIGVLHSLWLCPGQAAVLVQKNIKGGAQVPMVKLGPNIPFIV